MSIKNTETSWGSVAKSLHWIMAMLMVFMLVLGVAMGYMEKPIRGEWMVVHKSTGCIILALFFLRVIWRWINVTPKMPAGFPRWQKIVAESVHGILYVLLLGLPLTGLIMTGAKGYVVNFFWLFEFPVPMWESKTLGKLANQTHFYLAWFVSGLIVLHILGALKHHFVDKNGILIRMLPHRKNKS